MKIKISELGQDKKLTLKEFAALNDIPYKRLHYRLSTGMPVMDAISVSVAKLRSISNQKHGMHSSRTYGIWEGMIQRTTNPNSAAAHHYIGRGIGVCDSWRDFSNFLADMGEVPPGLTLERADNEKGYSPGNCKWATPKEQANNTRRNKNITAFGKTQSIEMWANELGIAAHILRWRLNNGHDIEKALLTPARRYKRKPTLCA